MSHARDEQAILAEAAEAAPDAWDATAGTSLAWVTPAPRGSARTHVVTLSGAVYLRPQLAPGVTGDPAGDFGYELTVWLRRRDGSSVTGSRPVWRRRASSINGAVAFPEVFARPPSAGGRADDALRYELVLALYHTPEPGAPDDLFATLTLLPTWGFGDPRSLRGQQRRLAQLGYLTGHRGASLSALTADHPLALVAGLDNPSTQQALMNFQADTDGLSLDGDLSRHASRGAAAFSSETGDAAADALRDAAPEGGAA